MRHQRRQSVTTRARRLALPLGALCAIGVTGCGGSSQHTSSARRTPAIPADPAATIQAQPGQQIDDNQLSNCLQASNYQQSDGSSFTYESVDASQAPDRDLAHQVILDRGSVAVWQYTVSGIDSSNSDSPYLGASDPGTPTTNIALAMYSFPSSSGIADGRKSLIAWGAAPSDIVQIGNTLAAIDPNEADTVRPCLKSATV